MRSRGLAVVCTLVGLGAFGAASALAAQPVFYSVAAVGQTVGPQKFAGTVGPMLLEPRANASNGGQIICEAGGTISGEVVSSTAVHNVVAVINFCETSGGKCNSPGKAEGVVETEALEGVIGNISGSTSRPGLRLFAAGEAGKEPKTGKAAEIECLGGVLNDVVTGSVVGSLSGAQGTSPAEGKFAASTKLEFAQTTGLQRYTTFLASECGEAGNCGPEQLISSINGTPEFTGLGLNATLKSTPFASKLGFTK